METKRLKRIVLQFGVVLLLIVMVFPSAFAATKGTNPAQLQIKSIIVADDLKSLVIEGVNFTRAKGSPVVSLGDTLLQIDNNYTDATLKAYLPDQKPFNPGDYRLTVTTGKGATEYDEYDLTIGATGSGAPGTIDRTTLQFKQCDVADSCSCDSPKVVMTYGVQCLPPGGTDGSDFVIYSIAYPSTIPTTPGGGITGISAYCWYQWDSGSAALGPPEKIWLVCF